ncbi:interleukin-27 subunit beta-like [Peromyscus maniculatus bairdii]|uniref:interleukin-27 subunit beta-like n=1 Tax=Peromyscus maniculatus bairdii TaxID=230844 RepID=UPI003FD151C1
MSQRLLLSLTLWASCSPGNAGIAALSQPRVRCRASRYPVAVDCSCTPLGAPNSTMATMATSFVATYRLGVAAQQQSQSCLQPNPQATGCTIPDVYLFPMVPYVLNDMVMHPSRSLLGFVAEQISECLSFPPLTVPTLHHGGPPSLDVPCSLPPQALFQPHLPPVTSPHPRLEPAWGVTWLPSLAF